MQWQWDEKRDARTMNQRIGTAEMKKEHDSPPLGRAYHSLASRDVWLLKLPSLGVWLKGNELF